MGYHTPFISPKGKDGGIDIIAYQDPLGLKTPRIKVQVKTVRKRSQYSHKTDKRGGVN
jgi:predicted Mrr-cat superfamily restriction endonuclease